MKLIPIDFEYHGTSERNLNVVCGSLQVDGITENYWTYNDAEAKQKLKARLLELNDKGYIFLSFNVEAEASSFISIGIDKPQIFKWIDLQAEWKMCINQNHRFEYGKHLIDGKKVFTKPPLDPRQNDEDEIEEYKSKTNSSPPPKNLAGTLYHLLGLELDKGVREILIRGDQKEIEDNKDIIMEYCASDIIYLRPALQKLCNFYKEKEILSKDDMLLRGDTVARVAVMTRLGYPVNREWVVNLTKNVGKLELDIIEDINSQFPDSPLFGLKRKSITNPTIQDYQQKLIVIKNYISKQPYANKWPKTKTGHYSLDQKTIEKFWSFRHNYPRGDIGAQFVRYKHFTQSMSGFRAPKNPTKATQYLIDSVGSDDRCRAYLNPYGSQTGRYQPKATQFIFLKSAWTRGIVQPRDGKVIVSIDYVSQEFLLQGLLGKDKAMLKAYQSGDVYLYFAKLAGAVPWEGTKKEYPRERNLFKAVTLAMGYGMGVPALAVTLSQKLGKEVSEEEAKEYKDLFETTYPDYADFSRNLKYVDYPLEEMLRVKDGWTMFGDNMNALSVGNFPLQGAGAVIARRAIALCQDAGLDVIFPLHDALYVEINRGDWSKIDLMCEKMIEACGAAFENPLDIIATELIGLDITVWGPGLENGEIVTPLGRAITTKNIYIDDRGKEEYEKFSKYFKEV